MSKAGKIFHPIPIKYLQRKKLPYNDPKKNGNCMRKLYFPKKNRLNFVFRNRIEKIKKVNTKATESA